MTEAREIARNIHAQLEAVHTMEGARKVAKVYMGADAGVQLVDNVAEELRDLNTYQGHANRETWCVTLWLGNEATHYEIATAIARDNNLTVAAQRLSDYVDTLCDRASDRLAGNGQGDRMGADLMRLALARVDWQAVAKSFADA